MNTENQKLLVKEHLPEGKDFAVSSDDGDNLFQEICKLIENEPTVEVDFEGIAVITTAYLNSAIGQLFSKYSPDLIKNKLKFSNVSPEDRILFLKVISNAIEYFANRKGFEDSANSALYDQ